ncbi:hypothetical protein [Sphingobium sp. BS19]|uniref:hypothetical protein n=1 Tax=Sphingobium sp. BS19 TaxID=3018973 RepID=UPI0022EF2A2F|nr:hypothetical protein [Sphingobium sp. BS19]GLI99098.1 hypothetical protein Sbs19_29160 [Sphingobium sp. BS19]
MSNRKFAQSDFDEVGNLLPGYVDQEGRYQRFDQPIRVPLPDVTLLEGMVEYQSTHGRLSNGDIH